MSINEPLLHTVHPFVISPLASLSPVGLAYVPPNNQNPIFIGCTFAFVHSAWNSSAVASMGFAAVNVVNARKACVNVGIAVLIAPTYAPANVCVCVSSSTLFTDKVMSSSIASYPCVTDESIIKPTNALSSSLEPVISYIQQVCVLQSPIAPLIATLFIFNQVLARLKDTFCVAVVMSVGVDLYFIILSTAPAQDVKDGSLNPAPVLYQTSPLYFTKYKYDDVLYHHTGTSPVA